MSSDCAGNGGRSHSHRVHHTVEDTGSAGWAKRGRPAAARAKPKSPDAEDLRHKQRPRIQLRDQDGTLSPPEDVAAAIKAADELFGKENDGA